MQRSIWYQLKPRLFRLRQRTVRELYFLLGASVDPLSKVEPSYHADQVKQSNQYRQWTGDTLVSTFSHHFLAFAIAYVVPSGSFNDAQALEHNDIYFRSTDVITAGGLYFS